MGESIATPRGKGGPSSKRVRRRRRTLRRALRPARHWLVARVLSGVVWLVGRLPHRGALWVGRVIGRMGYHLARVERRRAMRNLRVAFGDELSERERAAITRDVFASLGMAMLEAANSMRWTPEYLASRVEYRNFELAHEAAAGGRGVILLSGHYGNWELGSRMYTQARPVSLTVVMRDSRNPELNRLMHRLRGVGGTGIFSTETSALGIFRELRKGGVVGMMIDQDTKHLRGIYVDFFGKPSLTALGPAYLARKARVPLQLLLIHRVVDDPTRHVMEAYPPIWPDPSLGEDEDVQQMLQTYTTQLETEVRKRPGQWAWIHERWRHQPRKKKDRDATSTKEKGS